MAPAPDQTTEQHVEHGQQMALGHLEPEQATEHEMEQEAQQPVELQAEQQAVQQQQGQLGQHDKVEKLPEEFDVSHVKKFSSHVEHAHNPFGMLGTQAAHAQAIFNEFAPSLRHKLAPRCMVPEYHIKDYDDGVYPLLTCPTTMAIYTIALKATIGYIYTMMKNRKVPYWRRVSYWMMVTAYKRTYSNWRQLCLPGNLKRAALAKHKESNQAWWELVGKFLKELQAKAMAAGLPWDNNIFIPSHPDYDFKAYVATAEDLKQRSADMTVIKPSELEEEYQDIMGQTLSNLLDTTAQDVAGSIGGGSSSDDVAVVRKRLVKSLLKDPDAFKVAMAPLLEQHKEQLINERGASASKRGRKAAAPIRATKAKVGGQPGGTAPKLVAAPTKSAKLGQASGQQKAAQATGPAPPEVAAAATGAPAAEAPAEAQGAATAEVASEAPATVAAESHGVAEAVVPSTTPATAEAACKELSGYEILGLEID